MCKGNFRSASPLGPGKSKDERARLQHHRLRVPRRVGGSGHTSSHSVATVSTHLRQVDWKATLEKTDHAKAIAELSNKIAGRSAALMAFRRKYYSIIFDEVRHNRAGDLRGIVVSAKWRKLFGGLGQFGAALDLVGIPMKAAELSWNDLSTRGISANVMTTLAQWGTESVALGPTRMLQTGAELTGWALDGLGFKETANDITLFSTHLEGTIGDAQKAIDKVLSVDNARDVLTWDRSVINPRNWSLLKDAIWGHFEDLTSEAHPLHSAVVGATIGSVGAMGAKR
jgi:hypothetical protein